MHNADQETVERIEEYLDQKLTGRERLEFEQMLRSDPQLQEACDAVRMARSLVEKDSIIQLIRREHEGFMARSRNKSISVGKVVPVSTGGFKRLLRVAAVLVLLLSAGFALQYFSVTSGSVYHTHYLEYRISEPRMESSAQTVLIDSLYQAGQYLEVIQAFEALPEPGVHEWFLAGVSSLASGKYGQAVDFLEKMQAKTQMLPKPLYQQETEYYLALAYIQTQQNQKALELFRTIYNNPDHMYNIRVSRWDLLNLQILALKD